PDTGGVGCSQINVYSVVTEQDRQCAKALFHQYCAGTVVRQINSVQQVCAIAAIREYRFRPPIIPQELTAGHRTFKSSFMLCIGRRDTGWTNGIEVNRKPTAMNYVLIAGGLLRIRDSTFS